MDQRTLLRWTHLLLLLLTVTLATVPSFATDGGGTNPSPGSGRTIDHGTSMSSSSEPILLSTLSSRADVDEADNAIWSELMTPPQRLSTPASRLLHNSNFQTLLVDRWCLDCICQASSGCEAVGCQDGFCGPYKLTKEYWVDAGQPGVYVPGDPRAFQSCGLNKTCAEIAVQQFMINFRRDCNDDGRVDCWDFGRIHLAGSANCHATWIDETPFWEKFVECQEELEAVRPANNGQASAFSRPSIIESGSVSSPSPLPASTGFKGGIEEEESGSFGPRSSSRPLLGTSGSTAIHLQVPLANPVPRVCLDCLFQILSECEGAMCRWSVNDPYQISHAYWVDAGRPVHNLNGYHECARNISCAEMAVQNYMSKFGRDCNSDGVIDCLDFTRIHKAGPYACDAPWIESQRFWTQMNECNARSTFQQPTDNVIHHGVTNGLFVDNDQPLTQKPLKMPWNSLWIKSPLLMVNTNPDHPNSNFDQIHTSSNDFPSQHFLTPSTTHNVTGSEQWSSPHHPTQFTSHGHWPTMSQTPSIPTVFWRESTLAEQNTWSERNTMPVETELDHPWKLNWRPNSKHPSFSDRDAGGVVTDQKSSFSSLETVPQVVEFACLRCICEASSGCEEKACTKGLCGPYQISQEYWMNAGWSEAMAPGERRQAFESCATNKTCSELTIQHYMFKFQRDCDQDGSIDCWDFARIHLAGADRCHAPWVDRNDAWTKFRQCRTRLALTPQPETFTGQIVKFTPATFNPPFSQQKIVESESR